MEGWIFLFRKKKIVLKYTPLSFAAEVLCFLLIMTVLGITVILYPELPAQYNAPPSGMTAAAEPQLRETALLEPLLAVFLYIVLTGIGVIIRRAAPENNQEGVLNPILAAILGIKASYLAYAVCYTYLTMRILSVPFILVYIMSALIALSVCFGAVSVRKRYMKGRRSK